MTTTAKRRYPLLERLTHELHYAAPTQETFDTFAARAGDTLLFFADDPERSKETLDLAVIVPEIARTFGARLEVGVLFPSVANAIAPRYGVRRWPALVMLRDGQYVGAIEGLRDWDDYRSRIATLLDSEPSAPPQPFIPLRSESAPAACGGNGGHA